MTATRLFVIDGTATLFRSYFAMNKLKAPDGREVGGLLGFGQTLARYLRDLGPSHLALVFDSAERTFRHERYPDYKANRSAPPEDMEHQFDLSVELAEALGFRCFRIPGFEADDLMATFARRSREAGLECVLVTPDKDVLQLVGPGISVMDPKTLGLQDAEAVVTRLGVPPALVTTLQALAGDATDNVPGVAGVGAKTALALVQGLGDLDAIYARLDQVAGLPIRGARGLGAKLEAGRERAYLSLDLVRLDDRAPLSDDAMTLGMLRYRGPGPEADALCDRLGFHQPLRSLRALAIPRDEGTH
ncbi:MAG: hypothetical protein H6807_10400 [Planctomycetes bacterium]|nr:hypothetical protein [Planctomycetota bacterium]